MKAVIQRNRARNSSIMVPSADIVLLDVTLRDGGLAIDFAFSDQEAAAIVGAAGAAGIQVAEIGYYRPNMPGRGPAVCDLAFCERMAAVAGAPPLAVMAHTDELEPYQYGPLLDKGVALVRIPLTKKNAGDIPAHAQRLSALGLDFTVNVIRMSELSIQEIVSHAVTAEKCGARVVYVADSNGSTLPARVREVVDALCGALSIPVGFHAHDNLSLAFANSLAALEAGARYLDASVAGLGKGGANLAAELVTVYLNQRYGYAFDPFAFVPVSEQIVAQWISTAHSRRFQSALSGAMDLNMDALARLRQEAKTTNVSIGELLKRAYQERNTHIDLQEAV